jgi:hypothetical protein
LGVRSAGHVTVLGQLKGAPELKARLKAIGQTFKPLGKKWATEGAELARPKVPYVTGKLRGSFRVKSATATKAVVGGWYTAYFIDAGARWPSKSRKGKNTIFHKRSGYRMRPRPFRAYIAHEALRRNPAVGELVKLWNDAA